MSIKSCCGCASLRTGCIIVLTIEIILQTLINATVEWSSPTVAISANLVALLFIDLLIIGIVRRSRVCLWSFVIVNSILSSLILLVGTMCAVHYYNLLDEDENPVDSIGEIFSTAVIAAMFAVYGMIAFTLGIIQAIATYVVYSFIRELREEDQCYERTTTTLHQTKFIV